MKEEYFLYLGIFGIILIMLILNSYFLDKSKNKEGLVNMDANKEDTLASKSKPHLEKLQEKHITLENKVLANNPEYKTNYEQTGVTLHDIINKMMLMKMNSIYPDDDSDTIMRKLTELNTLYQSKHSLNDVVAYLSKQ